MSSPQDEWLNIRAEETFHARKTAEQEITRLTEANSNIEGDRMIKRSIKDRIKYLKRI